MRRGASVLASVLLAACAHGNDGHRAPSAHGRDPDAWDTASAATTGESAASASASGELAAARDELAAVPEPLRSILAAPALAAVLARAAEHRVQVVLGTVEPAADGRPTLRQVGFRAGAEYFYPASAVKLFAAVAALEHLAELRRDTGLPLGVDTPLAIHPLFADQQRLDADPTNLAGGTVTVRHEVRKLFLVSDNDAFNRLYDFVGQDGIARSLARAGLRDVRVVHRLEQVRSAEDHRRAPRVELLLADGTRHEIPARVAPPLPPAPAVPGLRLGEAYLRGGERVEGPMDFAGKNRVSLADLQRGLCKALRPDVDCGGGAAFALGDADRALVLEATSQLPRESANPRYDPAEHPDDDVKYLLPGIERVLPRERFRIHNKIGQAYGFTTENAWVVDLSDPARPRSFFLAATLYTNADGVLDDDRYEYREVARPFLAALGEAAARWFWAAPPARAAAASP